MQIRAITVLLVGAALIWLGGRPFRRQGRSERLGFSLALCAVALSLALIPADWRAWMTGGGGDDRTLILARELGLTGLLFLAGGRFEVEELWKSRRVILSAAAAGVLVFTLIAILPVMINGENHGAVITTTAAIVGTSLWLTGGYSLVPPGSAIAAASARGVAVALTVLTALFVHIYAAIPAGRLTNSAYAVVISYELVKIAVFFSLAWFVTTKFLERAASRVSPVRALIGGMLMSVLIFVLARSVIGSLGALAWSFVAGVVITRGEESEGLMERGKSVAMSVLLSFAFLPLLLQTHGRSLAGLGLVLVGVVAAMTCKFTAVWAGARAGGAATSEARVTAAATLASGETSVIFLGFGVTKWLIDGQFYFGILIYAFASMLLGQLLLQVFAQGNDPPLEAPTVHIQPTEQKRKGSAFRRGRKVILTIIAAVVWAFGSTARAQSIEVDPANHAMERIQSVVDKSAVAADRALAVSKLVNEGSEARKRGNPRQASEALGKAERMAASEDSPDGGTMIGELLRLMAGERAALDSKAVTIAESPVASKQLAGGIPSSVSARYRLYRATLVRILREENLPPELISVAWVESGFDPLALSRKGARGIWQFMPVTAERYGLTVSDTDDHRTHPEHSTRAAARYLGDLYRQFGDWKLALAAYNWREDKVRGVINKTGIRDFDELARRRLLPLETRKYVPAVLAVWARLSNNRAVLQ